MQSVNQKFDINDDTQAVQAAGTKVAERTSPVQPVDFVKATEEHLAGVGIRHELAAAFRRLGRTMNAGAAYERAKDFYKSSGHRWTRGLR